ncbi:hypothetical protein [Natrinema pallidum]|uniref:Uncharacterized protein n=2 Tax=Natrinema pallidum TaxID=69527 RepID=L9YYR3_9EURY|nr:hypothetical protein [Natrinema pallidum]ELY78786.1 hypothetical protein C487_07482 [Natrinema pallidum DSM 3751]QCW01774.1 hypothetical protein FGF80_00280 [Natrinema pallidum]
MRELRSCDFCGAEAIGAFEIVPPELEPTEAEQRRVVPCRDCKVRLETLLEPLLSRAGAERETDAADRDRDGSPTDASDGSEDVVASAGRSTEKRRRTTSPNATVSDASAEHDERTSPRDDTGAEADRDPASDPESGSQSDAPAEPVLEDGITFERTERAARDGSTESDETETGTAAAADSTDGSSDDESLSDEAATTDAPTGPPTAYSKVLRLLRNREFPMDRSAVEELAVGAYDLEPHEAAAIVDYAIAEDEFVDERGTLRRS